MIPVSLLSAYSYCPRKIFLERVLGLIEIPKEVTLKGTIRHAGMEALGKSEPQIVERIEPGWDISKISEEYKNSVTRAIRSKIIETKDTLRRLRLEPNDVFRSVLDRIRPAIDLRAGNVFAFMHERKLYGEELWLELTPKIKSEYKLNSEALRLSGVIDQVKVYKDMLVPIELKTGKAPNEGMWPGHRLQLASYMLLLEDRFNMDIGKGVVRYLDTEEERELVMNPFMREEVDSARIKVENLLAQKELPPRVKNENKCNRCGLKSDCFDDMAVRTALEKLPG